MVYKSLFAITPLNWTEWKAVLYISFPVIMIDETLKYFSVSSYSRLSFPTLELTIRVFRRLSLTLPQK